MDVRTLLAEYAEQPISTQILLTILKDYNRPYDKIMELMSQGDLIQLRKGLYMTSTLINSNRPEPFLVANHLYGPSYVSLDSALFYWGFIPERVFEITSVTSKLSKRSTVENTVFSFTHLPLAYYPVGIKSVRLTDKQTVLIGSPEKCICDKVITTAGVNLRSKKQAMTFLVQDLRMDKDHLRELNLREMANWLPVCPKRTSIKNLIEAIAEL
jgi:predicted transcriptional regulator of viral defense system